MTTEPDRELNLALDAVLERRRSVRRFAAASPPREFIERIIKAGTLAPYAGLAGRPLAEMRRFAVLSKGAGSMARAEALITARLKKNAGRLKLLSKLVPYLRRNAGPFVKVLENAAVNGLPVFKTAPCLIIVGERKGFPPVEKQALAYALENMWLKAAALGLGFQLVSAVQMMGESREFMELAGIPYGEFEVDGCAVGYPAEEPAQRELADPARITKWVQA
ncbi:MAG: nitroreductase family protein [Elusimicrobiota bacterium]